MTVTLSNTAHKIAAGVITAAIISMIAWSIALDSKKVDRETFEKQNIDNEKRFDKNEKTNERVLEVLMEIRLDVKELQTIEREKKRHGNN